MTPTIILLQSGFLQRLAPRSDGTRDLVDELAKLDPNNITAIYAHWNDNQQELAATIDSWLDVHAGARIILGGHSFGGYAATLLARCLYDLDTEVYAAVLTDAVGHRDGKPDNSRTITVSNVYRLFSFRRLKGVPHGSPIKLADASRTAWKDEIVSGVSHTGMNRLPAFRDTVLSLAKGEL